MTEVAAPYDAVPLDVRRLNWGWYGEPWPGYVCYDDDGRLKTEMRKPAPVGETCLWCIEPIVEGHFGQAIPSVPASGPPEVRHVHAECMLRNVVGPVGHLDGECACRDPDRPARSYREEALEVWARFAAGRGWPPRIGSDIRSRLVA